MEIVRIFAISAEMALIRIVVAPAVKYSLRITVLVYWLFLAVLISTLQLMPIRIWIQRHALLEQDLFIAYYNDGGSIPVWHACN